jgi:hypothetical protein
MTQTTVINAEKFKEQRERIHWIAELGDIMHDFSNVAATVNSSCCNSQFTATQLENFRRIQFDAHVRRWVVLYRKNNRNIMFDTRNYDSIIHTRLLSGLQDDSIKGDIVLYKTGQLNGWPYKTATGFYHIVTGNIKVADHYSNQCLLKEDRTHMELYKEWCEETLPDYLSTANKLRMSYTMYMLMNMNHEEWTRQYGEMMDGPEYHNLHRSGHMVWLDGSVMRDWYIGGMLHPRF